MATARHHPVIYEGVQPDAPIRQGDIFANIPRLELSLSQLAVVDEEHQTSAVSWQDLVAEGRSQINAICWLRPVMGIVVTQDCDAIRAADITLCEIRPLADVDFTFKSPGKGPEWWAKMIPRQCQRNLKWFYLPPDPLPQFSERMAVDFRVTIRVALADLQLLIHLRRGRLKPEADEHFRERLSEFFRRYPYDEWYSLDAQEFQAYQKDAPEAEPRPWQILPNPK